MRINGGPHLHDSRAGVLHLDQQLPPSMVEHLAGAMERAGVEARWCHSAELVGETGAMVLEVYDHDEDDRMVFDGNEPRRRLVTVT